jgi:aspartokinase
VPPLADAGAIASVVAFSHSTERARVASSPPPPSSGVTDALVSAATAAAAGDLDGAVATSRELRSRHMDVATDLMLDAPAIAEQNRGVVRGAGADPGPRRRRTRAVAPHARRHPRPRRAALHGHPLRRARAGGIPSTVADAQEFLYTDGRAGNAAPDLVRSDVSARAALEPLLERGLLVVVPGFIGAGCDGEVVTLGRGGTDLTATVLARALEANEVTLWKDVPGCMTADPRLVPDARVVPLLDAREASELAYYGAKVLHPRTLVPLQQGTILRIRPFANPESAGTTIVPGRPAGGSPVRALSAILKQALVTVQGNGMIGVPGVAARTFGALASTGRLGLDDLAGLVRALDLLHRPGDRGGARRRRAA